MIDTLRRWGVYFFVLIVVVGLVLAGVQGLILALFPEIQSQPDIVPYIIAIAVTGLIANIIIAIMGWLGISPTDLLPPLTLEERLKKEDKNRFLTTKNTNWKYLLEQARAAKKNNEYEWMYLFANACVELKPRESSALDELADAYFRLEMYADAIKIAKRLITIERLSYDGYAILGRSQLQLGDTITAKSTLEEAVVLADSTRRQFALISLVDVYEALGDVENAIQSINELIPLFDSEFQKDFYNQKLLRLQNIRDNREEVAIKSLSDTHQSNQRQDSEEMSDSRSNMNSDAK